MLNDATLNRLASIFIPDWSLVSPFPGVGFSSNRDSFCPKAKTSAYDHTCLQKVTKVYKLLKAPFFASNGPTDFCTTYYYPELLIRGATWARI